MLHLRRLLGWIISRSEASEIAYLKKKVARIQGVADSQARQIDTLTSELSATRAGLEQTDTIWRSLNSENQSLREQTLSLQTQLTQAQATIDCAEHEKVLLASLHDFQLKRVNEAIASLGFVNYDHQSRPAPEQHKE